MENQEDDRDRMIVRLPGALKKRVRACARERGLSMNSYVIIVLEDAVNEGSSTSAQPAQHTE